MADTAIIGRVAVKVMPDTSDFRRDLKRKLDALEKTLPKIKIPTTVDMSGASRDFLTELRKINQRNRNLDARKIRFHTTISTNGMRDEIVKARRKLETLAEQQKVNFRVDVDAVGGKLNVLAQLNDAALADVEDQLEDFKERWDPIVISVRTDLNNALSAAAAARLAALSRPRTVPLLPRVSKIAAAKAAAVLNRLSGARVLTDTLRDLSKWLSNLDKHTPKITAVGLGILGLAGYALSAASNLFALSSSLASIGAVALTLPGIFGGIAIGLGATIAVLKDFNQILPEVGDRLAALQNRMSERFWSVAEAPIRRLVDSLLPQFSEGLERTADSLGGFFAALSNSLVGSFDGALAGMFDDLNESIDIAATGTDAYAGILKTLGEVGAGYLPRLAQWFVDISNRFNEFLSGAQADGRLQTWINNGITALKDLGRSLAAIFDIFSGINEAATKAGGSTLAMLADTLERVAQIVNGEPFQSHLINVLMAAHQAMSNIARIAGPAVTDMFETLSQTLATLLPMVGRAIGTLLDGVATALSQPALQRGLITLFDNIGTAIESLAPMWAPLGQAIGALAPIIGELAMVLAPILAEVFAALSQVLIDMSPVIQRLIEALGGALLQAIEALTPYLPQITQAFIDIVNAILPLIPTLVEQLIPALPVLAEAFVKIAQAIAPLIESVVKLWNFLAPVLIPALQLLAEILLGAVLGAINGVTNIFKGMLNIIQGAWEIFAGIFTLDWERVWDGIVQLLKGLLQALWGFLETWWNVTILGLFRKALFKVKSLWTNAWNAVKNFFTKIWNSIKNFFTGIWNWMKGKVSSATSGIRNTISGWLNGIKSFFVGIWNSIKGFFSGVWNSMRSIVSSGISSVRQFFVNGWNAIKSALSSAWNSIVSGVQNGISNVIGWVRGIPGRILSALGNLGSLLWNAGKQILQGLLDGLQSMWGTVKGWFSDLTSWIPDWKGPAERDKVLLFDAGRLIIDGFVNGLESRYDVVRKSLGGLSNEIGGMAFAAPSVGAIGMSRRIGGIANGALSDSPATVQKVLNYHAAPGSSLGSEEDLFDAADRARMVGW